MAFAPFGRTFHWSPVTFTLNRMSLSPPPPLVAPQMWKLWISLVGLSFVGAGLYAPALLGDLLAISPALVSILAVVAGVAVFVGAWATVRCPGCSLGLVGHALSNQNHMAWLRWLVTVQVCPRCGYSSATNKEGQRNAT